MPTPTTASGPEPSGTGHRGRALARVLPATGLALALTAAPLSSLPQLLPGAGAPSPHPVRTELRTTALTPVAPATLRAGAARTPAADAPAARTPATDAPAPDTPLASARAAAEAPAQPTPGEVAVVGVTWAAGTATGDHVEVRVREQGRWGGWHEVAAEEDHGPDPGTAEASGARGGTAPYVVVGAEQVQVRVLSDDAGLPRDARVAVVDPGTSDADTLPAPAPGSASAGAAKPTIYSRAQWGADESKRDGAPGYAQVQLAFVHHTDSTNSYTAAQVPSIIRGIYAYHVDGQGWSDIGYNFLVDRFGRTWEGRFGGVDRAVIGAQTATYNSWSTGVSVIGNHSSTAVPSAVRSALSRVIAWKFTLAGIPATGTVVARDKSFNRISGHRDGYPTACPGATLYAALPAIRTTVRSLLGSLPRAAADRDATGDNAPDLAAYPGTLTPPTVGGPVTLLRGSHPIPVASGRAVGSGWNALRMVTPTPDLTGDGRPDVVAAEPGGRMRVYPGNGRGGFGTRRTYGSGWQAIVRVMAAGDRTGDGRNDLLAVHENGQLRLYPGNGRGYVENGVVIGTGWTGVGHPTSAGDLTGDGHPDVLAVRTNGQLAMYAGTADGGVRSGVTWGSGWGSFTALVGGGDLEGDGNPDIVARESSGRMRTYYSGDDGRAERSNLWGAGWSGMRDVGSGVDWDGDGNHDLLAVNPSASRGALVLFSGSGRRDFAAQQAPVPVPTGADLVRVVGDVDGDGRGDLVSRVPADDTLVFQPGRGGGAFGAPVVIGRGWRTFTFLEPVGDMTQDGVPDLLVRRTSGTVSLYPMRRDLSFQKPLDMEYNWGSVVSATGAGAFNGGDANGDIIALRGDKAIVMWRGGGHGAALLDQYVLATNQADLARIVGVDDLNGDGHRDVLAAATNGQLWLYAGNGRGGLLGSRQAVDGGRGEGEVLG